MSTQNDDYRAISYWPSKDERRIVAIKRTPEVDAMTDEELVSRQRQRDADAGTRVVTHEENGHRSIVVVRRGAESDKMSDEEIWAALEEWKRGRRHLRAVDDATE
ncbi:hypothetical protein ACWGH2_24275 [Streptomyces sp. NPDC054871]